MIKDVPFVSNTPDDTHCLNASYMMIAKYFDPDFSIPMDKWATITGYEPDKGTWANAGLVWFSTHNYEVKHISLFDYQRFVNEGNQYLISLNGPEIGQWMVDHTNLTAEIERVKKMLAADLVEQREPTIDDIRTYLDQGYLVRINVNYRRLAKESGYVGHAVVVVGHDDTSVIIHDPGLPAIKNRHVDIDELEAAWADPHKEDKEFDAFRPRR